MCPKKFISNIKKKKKTITLQDYISKLSKAYTNNVTSPKRQKNVFPKLNLKRKLLKLMYKFQVYNENKGDNSM